MRYLLDTDTVSNSMRPVPSPALLRRLARTPAADQATSSVTVGELYYGAYRRRSGGEQLIARIDALLVDTTVVPFDTDAARIYGDIRAALDRAGTPIGDADTRIAAIALANGLTVVTANIRHFDRVPGLLIENWLA
jgi:predicted nucleic acid-binding protein